jgi:hypothetical protein
LLLTVTECDSADIRSHCGSGYGFSANDLRPAADAAAELAGHRSTMSSGSYAVWWQESDEPRRAGKLQVGSLHLLLTSNGSGRLALPLDQIISVDYRRGELEIEVRRGSNVRIGNLDGPGVLLELSDALAA